MIISINNLKPPETAPVTEAVALWLLRSLFSHPLLLDLT